MESRTAEQALAPVSGDPIADQAEELEDLLPRLMRRLFARDPALLTEELPVAQIRLCSILQDGPRTMTALSEELGISVSAITQLAIRLEKIRFVERVVHERDRRMRLLRLTEYGRETMRYRRELRVRSAANHLARLSGAGRADLLTALRALLDACQPPAAPLAIDENQ